MKGKINSLDDIIESVPEDWSIKEKARYAYLMLGTNSFYNTKYNHLFGYPQLDIFNESDSYTTPNIRRLQKIYKSVFIYLEEAWYKVP